MRDIIQDTAPTDFEIAMPVVAIVGRPNVGKSSLFNAIIGKRLAIVHEESGVTRDRVAAPTVWRGRRLQLVDTGGLAAFSRRHAAANQWENPIRLQAEAAIAAAATIIMVVDVQEGLMPLDHDVAELLRPHQGNVVIAANKADNPELAERAAGFEQLGFGVPTPVSSLHRNGIGTLMDAVDDLLPPVGETTGGGEADRFRIAVVGRPNVGKSSLVNRLLNSERVMVSEVAGTTRDAIDIECDIALGGGENMSAVLIDTAGLRKRSKVDTAVEKFSVMRAREAIGRCQLALLVVESSPAGVTAQDRRVAQLVADSGKGCVIVANKWDICREHKRRDILNELRHSLPFMDYAPIVLASALSGESIDQVMEMVAEVRRQMGIVIPTSVVNQAIGGAFAANAPPVLEKPLKFYYATMKANCPPRFIVFVNNPKLCAPEYQRYLSNRLRGNFEFIGQPIRLLFRASHGERIEENEKPKPRAIRKIAARRRATAKPGGGRPRQVAEKKSPGKPQRQTPGKKSPSKARRSGGA